MRKNVRTHSLTLALLVTIVSIALVSGCGGGSSGGGGGWSGGGGGGGTVTYNPVITSVTNAQGLTNLTPGDQGVITGSDFGGSRDMRAGNQSYVSFVSLADGTSVNVDAYSDWTSTEIRFTTPSLTAGQQYYAIVYVVTYAGIYSSAATPTTQNTITVQGAQAIIVSISPPAVNQGSGTAITITGLEFSTSGVVNFGSTTATASSWGNYSITVNTPLSLTPGNVPVTVTPTGGQTSNSVPLTITGPTSPTLQSITPASIPAGAKTSIVLRGTYFGPAQGTVAIGAQSATVTSWTNTQVTCTTPALTAGVYQVSMTTTTPETSNTLPLYIGVGKVYALFVGINNYIDSGVNDLSGCVNDVNGMEADLLQGTPWGGATVVTLLNSNATKANIQNAIGSLASQVTAQDTFFFYYSGHGSNSGGTAYIVPADTDLTTASLIADTEMQAWLSAVNSSAKKVVIFDSCHSGGFVNRQVATDAVPRFVALSTSEQNFTGRGFSRQLELLSNIVFLGACRGSELSYEGNVNGGTVHGYFTYHCMQGLGTGTTIGPAGSGGIISAEGLFSYAAPLTVSYSSNVQNPVTQDNYSGGLQIK